MAPSIRGVPIEQEPEFAGVHSAIINETCQNPMGETPRAVEQCGNDATHTKIMYSGEIHEIAVCDECGCPGQLPDTERAWSGRSVRNLPADEIDFEAMTADDWEEYLEANDVRLVVRDQDGTHHFVHERVDDELTFFAYGSLGYSYKRSRAALEKVSGQEEGLEVVER